MTKIDIYSGFLGAGKTTLIKKMIAEGYKGEKLLLALLSERQLWANPPALGVYGVIGTLGQLVICCRGRLLS